MTFAAPLLAVLGAGAAAATILLHFIARAQPPERDLPTARFVPLAAVRAPAFERRPSDLRVLALRALAVLLLGMGLAGPAFAPARRALARVVLLDRSRAVADHADALARARAALRDGDVLVVFDSAARVVTPDSALSAPARSARGSLSTALVIAVRASVRLAPAADSLELVIVSPLVEEEWDAATEHLRTLWPGGVRVTRVAAAAAPAMGAVSVTAPAADPVRATVALLGARGGAPGARIVRVRPTAADSAAAAAGGVLVDWPADPAERFGARARPDTVGAVATETAVVVAPFARTAALAADRGGSAVAHWVDGEVAATERRLGEGCVREVAVPVASVGDLALRPAMQRFVRAMAAPCGGTPRLAPVPDSVATSRRVSRAGIVRDVGQGSRPLVVLLLALGALALVVERLVRRRTAS